jgi:hypothetical protein
MAGFAPVAQIAIIPGAVSVKDESFVKSPDAALRCILRHCGVLTVRLTPQALRALPANFFQSRLNFDFYEFIEVDE